MKQQTNNRMILEKKLGKRIIELTGEQNVNLAQELAHTATTHFAGGTRFSTSTFEVKQGDLTDITTDRYQDGEMTIYKLPFCWAGCDHIRVIFKEISNKTACVNVSMGRWLSGAMYGEGYDKIYDCDRFDYDDEEALLSFRPI